MNIGSQGIFSTPEELDRLTAFLHNLAQALHTSGMPAHDLERNLNAIGQRFGVNIECIAVLTMLTLIITKIFQILEARYNRYITHAR